MRRLAPFALPLALLAAGCSSTEKDFSRALPEGMLALEKITDPALIPDFGPGLRDRESLAAAIDHSLAYYAKPSSQKYFPYLDISHARAVASLHAFKEIVQTSTTASEFQARIVQRFDVYRSIGWDGSGEMLFTGYCEPIYEASRERTERFRYPLYGRPEELVKDAEGTPLGWRAGDEVGSNPRREDFDNGCLRGRGLEIAWLADPVDVYVIHVQGSATLRLTDGTTQQIGYAGKTEYPYTSIGKAMVKDGKFEKKDLSLRRIREYFRTHPEDVGHYLQKNNCYVFFQPTTGGPFGSLGAKVTPFRSVATDKAVFPRGGVAYAVTKLPAMSGVHRTGDREFRQFLLDQDTGGGIRSAGRADIFLGTGPDAEAMAGSVSDEGRMYYLFVKESPGGIASR